MYESAGFMTVEHTKVEDCLYYSLSPSCTVFTIIRRAVKKFSEMWYSTEMVGHMTALT